MMALAVLVGVDITSLIAELLLTLLIICSGMRILVPVLTGKHCTIALLCSSVIMTSLL